LARTGVGVYTLTFTDGNTGTSDVNVNRDAITRTTNDHVRNTRTVELVLKETAKHDVLGDVVGVTLSRLGRVREPL
jgi:hypothetical protein